MLIKKLCISFIIVLLSLINPLSLYGLTLVPGGESIGIELDYQGVLITGGYNIVIDNQIYNPLENNFKSGDIIINIDETKVTSIDNLCNYIKSQKKLLYNAVIIRNDKQLNKELRVSYDNDNFSTGLFVKDSLSGVGTLTFYNPENHSFGALGHAMFDSKNESDQLIQNGYIFESTVTSIKKAKINVAGNKIANISSQEIGSINSHNNFGLYGTYNYDISNRGTLQTATIDEITLGKAYFLTVLDGNEISNCEIEITKLNKQDSPIEKGIEFVVTDENVISKANGIVQGMSGSPIIQNDKIIGCVTHVSSNDPMTGFGLYIEWMIETDDKVNN